MKPYSHIIWDWNGTLLDDVVLLHDIVNGFLAQYGLKPLKEEEHRECFGFPVIEYYKRMGFDFQKASYKRICEDFTTQYYERVGESSLREGALDVLQTINRNGITQSILSVSEQAPLEKAVRQFGIQDYFIDIVGREDHSGGSKLEAGKKFLEGIGMNPRHVLFIGDTDHDYEVAQGLGAQCLLVESGYQSREKITRCGCPALHSLREILLHI